MSVATATFTFTTGTITGRKTGVEPLTLAPTGSSATLLRVSPTRSMSVYAASIPTGNRLHPSRGVQAGNLTPMGPITTRAGVQRPMASIGTSGGGGSGITTYYKKRSRDSGSPTPAFVTWVTTISAQPYPFSPPFGGPLVDEVIADTWQV